MQVFDVDTNWEERAFYFCGQIDSSVIGRVWAFRSDDEYDSDENAAITAMNLICRFRNCLGRRAFLVFVSDIASPSLVRTKKGVLWDYKALRGIQNVAFEYEAEHSQTRLGAVVDLSDFGFDTDSSALLNWGQGMIVFSDNQLDFIADLAKSWCSTTSADALGFNYDKVAESLKEHEDMGILRYLPPSASRPESVVVAAREDFVNQGALECIESIT